MAACNATTTKGGAACKRPPSRDSAYCLAHDPARVDDHAAISKHGGHMRHHGETLSIKDEVRGLIADVRSGVVSPGAGNVMATLYRLLREITAEDARQAAYNASDTLVESIQALRGGNPPDFSEPEPTTGGSVEDMSEAAPPEPYDPDAPVWSDYDSADAFVRDSHAHKAAPLGQLSVAERRKRWQSGQRG